MADVSQITPAIVPQSSDAERAQLLQASTPVDGERAGELAGESADELTRNSAWIEVQIAKERSLLAQRRMWSRHLLDLITFITVFDMLLILLIGTGWIKFSSPAVTIPAFIGANLAETYGLGRLVVKFLFNDGSEDKKKAPAGE